MKTWPKIVSISMGMAGLTACGTAPEAVPTATPTETPLPTATDLALPTLTTTPTRTPILLPSSTPTITATPTETAIPAGSMGFSLKGLNAKQVFGSIESLKAGAGLFSGDQNIAYESLNFLQAQAGYRYEAMDTSNNKLTTAGQETLEEFELRSPNRADFADAVAQMMTALATDTFIEPGYLGTNVVAASIKLQPAFTINPKNPESAYIPDSFKVFEYNKGTGGLTRPNETIEAILASAKKNTNFNILAIHPDGLVNKPDQLFPINTSFSQFVFRVQITKVIHGQQIVVDALIDPVTMSILNGTQPPEKPGSTSDNATGGDPTRIPGGDPTRIPGGDPTRVPNAMIQPEIQHAAISYATDASNKPASPDVTILDHESVAKAKYRLNNPTQTKKENPYLINADDTRESSMLKLQLQEIQLRIDRKQNQYELTQDDQLTSLKEDIYLLHKLQEQLNHLLQNGVINKAPILANKPTAIIQRQSAEKPGPIGYDGKRIYRQFREI